MKKVILLLILVFFIQGCTEKAPIYAGTQGLEIKFLNNAPPSVVRENDPLMLMVEIWNRGAYDVNGSGENFAVIGLRYDPIYFTDITSDVGRTLSDDVAVSFRMPGGLAGKSEIWPQGQRIMVPLKEISVNPVLGAREAPLTRIETIICYPYKTFLTQMVCIDTDIYGVEDAPLCTNRGAYSFSGQGAPISVNKVEVNIIPKGFVDSSEFDFVSPVVGQEDELRGQYYLGGYEVVLDEETGLASHLEYVSNPDYVMVVEPVFRIYAQNIGKGDVFISKEPGTKTENVCSFGTDSFEYRVHNRVRLSNATLGGNTLVCDKTEININNRLDFISCRLNDSSIFLTRNIELPLSVELEYFYRESDSRRIEIRRY
jgi:hypothetical protein